MPECQYRLEELLTANVVVCVCACGSFFFFFLNLSACGSDGLHRVQIYSCLSHQSAAPQGPLLCVLSPKHPCPGEVGLCPCFRAKFKELRQNFLGLLPYTPMSLCGELWVGRLWFLEPAWGAGTRSTAVPSRQSRNTG